MPNVLFPGQVVDEGFALYQFSGCVSDFLDHLVKGEVDGDSRWIEGWPAQVVEACEAKSAAHRMFNLLGIAAPPKSAEAIRMHSDAIVAIDGAETRWAYELVSWGRILADRDPTIDDPVDPVLPQFAAILFRFAGLYSTFVVCEEDRDSAIGTQRSDSFVGRAGAPDGVVICLSLLPALLGDAGIAVWNGAGDAQSRLEDLSRCLRNLTDRSAEWRRSWLERVRAGRGA